MLKISFYQVFPAFLVLVVMLFYLLVGVFFFILIRSFLLSTASYTFLACKFLGCAEIFKALSKLGFIRRLRAYLPPFMVAIFPLSVKSSGSIPVYTALYLSEGHLEGVRAPVKMGVEHFVIPEPSSVDPNAVVAITGPKFSLPYIKNGILEWTGVVNEGVVDCPSIRSVDVIPFNIWDLYDISLSDLVYYLDHHYGVDRFFPGGVKFLDPYCVDLNQFVASLPDLTSFPI